MTEQLEGAELVLAAAKVMGKAVKTGEELWPGQGMHSIYTMATGSWVEWYPDLGGDAAWEMHQWLRSEGYNVLYSSFEDREGCEVSLIAWDPFWCEPGDEVKVSEEGETDDIARCRAVVALNSIPNHKEPSR